MVWRFLKQEIQFKLKKRLFNTFLHKDPENRSIKYLIQYVQKPEFFGCTNG